jgi:hypothetical protein
MEVSFYFAKVADVADINVLSSLPPHPTFTVIIIINTAVSSFDNPQFHSL